MKNKVTILIPISRDTHLDRLFASLEFLECDSSRTNLLTVVDGDVSLFLKVRNKTELSKFNERLCIQYKSQLEKSESDIFARRIRIADIHNFAKKHVLDCDFILGIEDDTIVPSYTLDKFLKNYALKPYAGFFEGIELGRWSMTYIGAWRFDDIYEPQLIQSVMPEDDSEGVTEIDAGGLFCFMTRRDTYVNHEFKTFEENSLGPDVDFGISLRRQGYSNYLDWHISCNHLNEDGAIHMGNSTPRRAVFKKKRLKWLFYPQ